MKKLAIYKEWAGKIRQKESEYLPPILTKLANLEQTKIIYELAAPWGDFSRV